MADTHFHAWAHPDDGTDTGNRSAMFWRAHPFRTRQAAREYGKRLPFFAAVLACDMAHNHTCGANCPRPARKRGEKAAAA